MKIRKMFCFVMAFAMLFGMMPVVFAAGAKTYSKTNCTAGFVTSQYVGSTSRLSTFGGITDTCENCDYSSYPSGIIHYHYSAVCRGDNHSVIGPYDYVTEGYSKNLTIDYGMETEYTLRLRIENAYYHSNHSNTSISMSTNGSFTAYGVTPIY